MTSQTTLAASPQPKITEFVNVDEFEVVTLLRESDGHIRVKARGNRDGLRHFLPINARDDDSARARHYVDELVREAVIDELATLVDAHVQQVNRADISDEEIERAVWNVTHNSCDPAEAARIVLDYEEVA